MILGVGRRYMMYVYSALISDLTSTIGRLSAYLFEITQNQTYRNAASLSQSFIESTFHNPDTGTIRDAITLSNCRYPNNNLITYNSGVYLEAVSVLGRTTNNVQLSDM